MKHSNELKEQVIKEIQEVGNISLVCKKHGLKSSTVHGWLHKNKNKDKIADKKLSRQQQKRIEDLELQVEVLTSLLKKTYPLWNNEKKLS